MRTFESLYKAIYNVSRHQGYKRYFLNTSWFFIENVARIFAGLFVGIWVARYLEPKQFGILSYALAFVALFSSIAKLGLDHVVVRELVNYPEKRDEILGTAFWLRLTGAFVFLSIISVFLLFAQNDSTIKFYILIIAAGLIFDSFDVIDYYFQAIVQRKYVSLCKLVQLALSSLVKILLIIYKADLYWFVLSTFADQMFLAVSLFIAYIRKNSDTFLRKFSFDLARSQLAQSYPLLISSYTSMIWMNIDQVMVNLLIGPNAGGQYSAAVKLSNSYYIIPMLITNSLYPAIINSKKISSELYLNRLQNLYGLIVWLSIISAIIVSIFGNKIVVYFFGSPYILAGPVLAIHMWGCVFGSLDTATKKWFVIEGLQNLLLIRVIACTIINILLNFALIPTYGIRGAAAATLLASICSYFSYIFTPKLKILCLMTTKTLIFPFYFLMNKSWAVDSNSGKSGRKS